MIGGVRRAVIGAVGVVAAAAATSQTSDPPLNAHPIVAVLTVPAEFGEDCDTLAAPQGSTTGGRQSCFSAVYVKWLEAAGARVAPLLFDAPDDAIDAAVQAANGILFTGGDVDLSGKENPDAALYMKIARRIFDTAVAENVPLWGTCMGLQTLSVLVGGYDVLDMYAYDSEGLALALDMTAQASQSKLFGDSAASSSPGMMPASAVTTLASKNVTTNLHHDGVPPATFASSAELSSFFDVLSTNVDRQGVPFVSTIEAKAHPIFATQWHPERNQFEFNLNADGVDALSIDHSPDAIVAMHYLAVAFVNEARKNTRAYPSPADEDAALIYNWPPVGTSSSTLAYYFDGYPADAAETATLSAAVESRGEEAAAPVLRAAA